MNSATPEFDRDQYEQFQVTRSLYGLTPAEQAKLDKLDELASDAGVLKDESVELTIASLDAGFFAAEDQTMTRKELPVTLRQKILDQASRHVVDHRQTPSNPPAPSTDPTAPAGAKRRSGWTVRERGLLVALAASLLFGLASVSGWLDPADPTVPVAPTLAEQRQQLIDEADATLIAWTATDDPAASGVSGDIVWSDQLQSGFMRFRNLPVNDSSAEQYQLWIFDIQRSDALPVDGGVFDITRSGEVIVPIDAKLNVSNAWQFAVTIEEPGGVVQSDRDRLPLLATLDR